MSIQPAPENLAQLEADAVVIGVDSELSTPAARQLDELTGGLLTRLLQQEEWKPKLASTFRLYAPVGMNVPLAVLVGLEDDDYPVAARAFRAAGAGAKAVAGKPRGQVAFYLDSGWDAEAHTQAIAGALVGSQGQDLYRAEKRLHPPEQLLWQGPQEAFSPGVVLGRSVNQARQLVNEPPDVIYPESMAQRVQQWGTESGLDVEVMDEKQLEAEGFGAMLAVGRGSERPPRLVVLRWSGGPQNQPPLALVGKGVTFDSGGLSLKPSGGMKTMKCDMAGAAAVVGTMLAVARLKLPVNVLGLIGLVENLPSGHSMKLGDVLRARNGTTIEVLNTDAEGRLVLADVLSKAVDLGAGQIIDLATLTGSCLVALGTDVAGLMTNNQPLADQVTQAATACGEPVWPLPMFKEFGELMKSDIADIKNISEIRWGGTITAAKFLEHFVGDCPWVHLDIAGPAYLEKPKPWIDAGGTGCMVRTLVHLLQQR